MIIKNAIRCNICGDEIESKHRHDYVYSASVVPVLSMVDTTTYEGVLEMRAVLLIYP